MHCPAVMNCPSSRERLPNLPSQGASTTVYEIFSRAISSDLETMKLSRLDTQKNLQTQYLNAVNDLMNNQRNFKKQKDNYLLAEEVYTVTTDRYREGITSMTEVLQDEMRMSEAQNNYISAHYNYRVTNLMLLKLTGQISSLFK